MPHVPLPRVATPRPRTHNDRFHTARHSILPMPTKTATKARIPIYDEEQREMLRAAGRFNAQLMDFVRPHVRAGVTTNTLDRLVHEYTLDHGHVPACLGYKQYPKTICTSVNDVICHGIPNDTPLKEGDIVNVDVTTVVDGWYGDQSETFMIGEVSDEARRLVQRTFEALWVGIRAVKPGGRVIDIGSAILKFARKHRLSVVQEFQGHGLGTEFHQEPAVPHYPEVSSFHDVIRPGMCFTVEPMLNLGRRHGKLNKKDGWTVRTADRKLSAQFEHTVFVNEDGPEITTWTQDGPQEGHVF
jgi:methionyl aminopeptidase